MPTGVAPHKEIEEDPGAAARLEMVEAAVEDEVRFEASAIEIERGGVSYTHLTLEELDGSEPGCELYLLLGADAALGLPDWKQPERIAALARLAVARRDGIDEERVMAALGEIGADERSTLLDLPPFGVSSSLVRERATAGMPLRYLVPDSVATLIHEQGIYRDGGGGSGTDRA